MSGKLSKTKMQPTQFDGLTKLNVIADRECVFLQPERVRTKLLVGHPDALALPLSPNSSTPFAFQSVYFEGSGQWPGWRPCYRYMSQSLARTHSGFFRVDIHLKWKNLYEIMFHDRARHLYFDVEQPRDDASSHGLAEHDLQCWNKVQMLKSIVTEIFRCAVCVLMLHIYACCTPARHRSLFL